MALNDLFRAARVASAPSSEAADRVHARVRESRELAGVPGLLANVGAADPAASHRVMARVRASRRRRYVLGAMVGVAAALGVVFGWPASPRALDVVLSTADSPLDLTDAVVLEVEGHGRVDGTEQDPVIRWERGRLDVRVDPEAGIRLVVDTPEARITVLGTVFVVERDPVGTRVDVERGRVLVSCVDGADTQLRAGATTTCWPVTLAGLLGRARTLEARGAPPDDVESALDRAMATAGPRPLRGEVIAHRVRLFQATGRPDAAAEAARQYLDEAHGPRRHEIEAFLDATPGATP